MNWTIFKNIFKMNWKLLIIFVGLLCIYLAVIISLIDPNDMEKIQELYGTMGSFVGAFSIRIDSMTSPLNYTASTFFSVIVMAFTMVFYVIQANSLIAKRVEDTSIACTLAAPVKRSTLVLTCGIYLIFSMVVLFVGILVCGSTMLGTFGNFDFLAYLNLVGVTFVLCTAVAMLSYFLSIAFCDSKLGSKLAVGVPIGLLFLQVLGGAGGEKTEWLTKMTPFGYLDSVGIVTGKVETLGMYLIFGCAIIVFLIASAIAFNQKRLPI